VTVTAQYFFGSPVARAEVEYYVTRAPDWAGDFDEEYGDLEAEAAGSGESEFSYGGGVVAEGKVRTDDQGVAHLRRPTRLGKKPTRTVTATGGSRCSRPFPGRAGSGPKVRAGSSSPAASSGCA
jgi:hypothetical protein